MLRNFFAILLLSIYVFTSGGYWLVISYFEQRADRSLLQKLDQHQYNEAELITIKVPLPLPYIIDRTEFERCDGTITINGVYYSYVKRKLINDTLFLQCIANNEKSRLSAAKDEYAKISAGSSPSSASEKAAGTVLKIFFFGYNYRTVNDADISFFTESSAYIPENDHTLYSCFIPSPEKPPEMPVI